MVHLKDMVKEFGDRRVFDCVNWRVRPGDKVGLAGENGAGKTTLLRTIMGLVSVTAGDIRVDGTSRRGAKTWDTVTEGVVMIPEGRMIFPDMSVEDNLMMGAFPRGCRAGWKRDRSASTRLP